MAFFSLPESIKKFVDIKVTGPLKVTGGFGRRPAGFGRSQVFCIKWINMGIIAMFLTDVNV